METNSEKEVYFGEYCQKCRYVKLAEEEPCFECLTNPVNTRSHKPVKWEKNSA